MTDCVVQQGHSRRICLRVFGRCVAETRLERRRKRCHRCLIAIGVIPDGRREIPDVSKETKEAKVLL